MTTKKVYRDKDGNVIPTAYIFTIDKKKHNAALKFHAQAMALQKQMASFKTKLFAECDELFAESLRENRVKVKEGAKGGYTIQTTDKAFKIEVRIAEFMSFNDNINIAQSKINEFLQTKIEGLDMDVKTLIDNAFQTSKGHLDARRIVSLLKLRITHPLWVEAMDLIKQSIENNNSKRYVSLSYRLPDGDYQDINLNFASI